MKRALPELALLAALLVPVSLRAATGHDAPAKPVSHDAPTKPVSQDAPTKPVSYDAPAKPVSYDAPTNSVTYDAPAKPVSYDAPAKPATPTVTQRGGAGRPGRAAIRLGDHINFGRVVFLVPPRVTAQLAPADGGTLRVLLPGAGDVPGATRGTRNILAITGGTDGALLELAAGTRPVLWQMPGRVVVDVYTQSAVPPGKRAHPPAASAATATPGAWAQGGTARADPAPGPPATHAAATKPIPAAPAETQPSLAKPASQAAGASSAAGSAAAAVETSAAALASVQATPLAAPAPTPFTPAAEAVPTDGLVAVRLPPESAGGADAILVPFDREVAAAAFPRDGAAHVIFDDSKPVDLSELKDDPVFGGARITLLPAATGLTLHLAPGKRLTLHRRPDGWVVAVVPQESTGNSAAVSMKDGMVTIATKFAADTVVLDDPVTSARLLVGTVRGDGPGIVVPHRSPDVALLRSWTGVLLAAPSDRLALRATKAGFTVATASGPAVASVMGGAVDQAMADAGLLTRRFDFAPLPVALLRARMVHDMVAMARAPKLARFQPRVRAAQDMLALGMGREAGSLLRLAVREDPSQAANPDAAGLLAMADWLAGEGDGAGLSAPSLGSSDEISLWRAALHPAPDARAAATLADTWHLLLAYPEPLRRRLMPLVAEKLLKFGQKEAAAALLARTADATLDPARALALQSGGKTEAALAILDRVAAGWDRKAAAAAARDAIEMRLAAGILTPAAAADALDAHLYDWRDDALEADLRLRIAALRSKAGLWRPALAGLREAEALYPSLHDRVHDGERQVIADLLASNAASHLAPLDLVALVGENADLLSEKGASETLAPVLLDKLLALDLPDRADPILARLMAATAAPEAKAGLGAKLATLRLDQGNGVGARDALASSDAAGLPASLTSHRAVLQARSLLLDGDNNAALALLAAQDTPEALELRAQLLEKRHDWPAAETVLQALVHASLPASGTLTDSQQDLVLRLASAASEAGDMAFIQRMQSGDATRLAAGPRAQLFQALATQPIRAVGDLPRAAREADAARAVPAALASYDAH